MSERAYRLTFVVAPYLLCTIIPTIFYGVLLGQWGTNLVWGHVFGLGWFAAQSYCGPEHWRTAAFIGVFVWPPVVLVFLWFASGQIWRMSATSVRTALIYLLAASSVASVPAQTIERFYAGRGVPVDFNVLWNAY